jgi:hypothetical protein
MEVYWSLKNYPYETQKIIGPAHKILLGRGNHIFFQSVL